MLPRMAETALTLYVDLPQGTRLDLEAAANAALAWSRMIKAIGQHVDPFTEWKVELDSATPGSQKLRSFIRLQDRSEVRLLIIAAIGGALGFMLKEVAAWGIGEVMDYIKGPDAPAEVRSLSEEEVRALAEQIVVLLKQGVGQEEAKEVYDALEKDPDVSGAGATSARDKRPDVVVPRASFPGRPGPSEAKPESQERVLLEQMEAVLIRPLLTSSTTRRWSFQTRGGTFGAPVQDTKFLEDLLAGRLNVPLRQGIVMLLEVEITEEAFQGLWRIKDRVIKRVLEVKAPPVQTSLFDALEQDDADDDDQ